MGPRFDGPVTPLPTLPEKVFYTFITGNRFETYVPPLYQRGWRFRVHEKKGYLFLTKPFKFPDDVTLLEFLARFGRLTVKAKVGTPALNVALSDLVSDPNRPASPRSQLY